MTTTTHKMTRWAIFLAAAIAALTLAAPLAQATPNDVFTCTQASPYPGWVSVIDEQGVPVLFPVGYAPANGLSCSQVAAQPGGSSDAQTAQHSGSDTTMRSPYPGWVVVIDEQGVPTLYPSGQVSG
jgi:hypothetical protein